MVQAANKLHTSEITEGDLASGVERKCRIKCCQQERAKKYHCAWYSLPFLTHCNCVLESPFIRLYWQWLCVPRPVKTELQRQNSWKWYLNWTKYWKTKLWKNKLMPKQLHNLLLEDGDVHAWEAGVDLGNGTLRSERRKRSLTETRRHALNEADCQGSPFKRMQAHRRTTARV